MTKVFTVAKGEFYRYFISPLAYVYLVCFLLLSGSLSLYFGGIFSLGSATLKPMFEFLPWIYLLFVSGIAMRLWSEEFRSGTILQISTLAVSVNDFVWGKFLAAWGFCGVALVLTFPFVITLNILGEPDNWVIFNSYLGAFLLSGAMLAVSQTASALTKNQVISLVISVFMNLLFFLSGLEYVLSFFRSFAPEYIINLISSFSFLTHLSLFISGVFDFSSLVFFVSLIIVFNFLTFTIINYKTSGTTFWLKTKSSIGYVSAVALVFVAFVGINLFANGVLGGKRIDFTDEKLFTLSESTKKVLKELESPVTAKVYYSPVLGERDDKIRRHFDNLKLLLDTYMTEAGENFDYQIYNPEPLSDVEDRAIASGLQALFVSDIGVGAYFGVVFSDENGNSTTIPILPLQRASLMEQDLTEKIYLLSYKRKNVGLLTSLPILPSVDGGFYTQSWQIADEISKFYNIKNVKTPADITSDLDVLIMAHPKEMPEDMEDAVYNYSINGGKILAFFDVATEALNLIGPRKELLHQSIFGNLPQKWGVKFFDKYVVADMDFSSQVSVQEADYSGTTQDLIQFFVTDKGFYSEIPEMRNLKRVLMTSVSIFRPLEGANIYFVPLMEASKNSQILPVEAVVNNIHPAEILRYFKADNVRKVLATHILSKDENKPFEVIAVGDTDLLYDSFWASSITIGNKSYTFPMLDNGNFVLNSLDVLTGDDTMLDLRGKSPKLRPFEDVEKEQKQKLLEFKIKEKDIFDQIELIRKGLKEISDKKAFEGRDNFTVDELAVLSKVKSQLEEKRKNLYEIRLDLNNNLKNIDAKIKFFNIYAIPLMIVLFVGIANLRKISFCKPKTPIYNSKFWFMSSIVLLCVALGVLGVFVQPKIYKKDILDKPLFENLDKEINNVNKIILKDAKNELVFEKKDNLWVLPENPDLLVKQSRITNLLMTLVQASFYEKKSNKFESLEKFGLLPIDNKNSTAVKIVLKNKDKKIASLDVGKYDVELGRGALGAYVRLGDNFQTWLVKAPFIDLSLAYDGWVYGEMWNLQFGRFSLLNSVADVDKLAELMKAMLNIKTSKSDKMNTTTSTYTLKLSGEDFTNLQINFYEGKEDKFLVKYNFIGDIKNSTLKEFVKRTENNVYEINKDDMEKIRSAVESKESK